jgi:hypothetical protein
MSRRENRKIRHENVILKATKSFLRCGSLRFIEWCQKHMCKSRETILLTHKRIFHPWIAFFELCNMLNLLRLMYYTVHPVLGTTLFFFNVGYIWIKKKDFFIQSGMFAICMYEFFYTSNIILYLSIIQINSYGVLTQCSHEYFLHFPMSDILEQYFNSGIRIYSIFRANNLILQ